MTPRTLLLLGSALVAGASLSRAADSIRPTVPAGWFEWPYVEPVSGSALDTSSLNDKPAGAHGPVVARDGHFVMAGNGERLRFWGCNVSSNERSSTAPPRTAWHVDSR